MAEILFLTVLGLIIGILAGMMGVGGGIFMVPALIFLPSHFTIQQATGISVMQAFISGLTSAWTHYQKHTLSLPLLVRVSIGSIFGGFFGGLVSGMMPDLVLYLLFAALLVVTVVLSSTTPTPNEENLPLNQMGQRVPLPLGLLIGVCIGFLAANTGIGGAVLLLPVLIYLFSIPTRVAIGTGAGFVVITSMSAVIGKLLSGLIPFPEAFWVAGGGFVGGLLGARLSHKLSPRFLRLLLLFFVSLSLIRVCIEIMYYLTDH